VAQPHRRRRRTGWVPFPPLRCSGSPRPHLVPMPHFVPLYYIDSYI
jgi:hypothetical protein